MVKIIYAGYSKCGTKTFAKAFRTMGLTVHDFEEYIVYDFRHWEKFESHKTSISEKKKIIREMLKDVDAVTDLPYYNFWREILDQFPEATLV